MPRYSPDDPNTEGMLGGREIRDQFGICASQLSEYVKDGCPHKKLRGRNYFDAIEFGRWLRKRRTR